MQIEAKLKAILNGDILSVHPVDEESNSCRRHPGGTVKFQRGSL